MGSETRAVVYFIEEGECVFTKRSGDEGGSGEHICTLFSLMF